MKRVLLFSLFSLLGIGSTVLAMEEGKVRLRILNDTKLKLFVKRNEEEIKPLPPDHVYNFSTEKGESTSILTGERKIYTYTPSGNNPKVTINIKGNRREGYTIEKLAK